MSTSPQEFRRANGPEAAFEELARSRGLEPSKQGWPDYICYGPEDKIIAVEVKRRREDGRLENLWVTQARVLDALSAAGIECFVSDGETLEPYDRAKHRSHQHTGERPGKAKREAKSEEWHQKETARLTAVAEYYEQRRRKREERTRLREAKREAKRRPQKARVG